MFDGSAGSSGSGGGLGCLADMAGAMIGGGSGSRGATTGGGAMAMLAALALMMRKWKRPGPGASQPGIYYNFWLTQFAACRNLPLYDLRTDLIVQALSQAYIPCRCCNH